MKRELFEEFMNEMKEKIREHKAEGRDHYWLQTYLVCRVTAHTYGDNPLWTARQLSMVFGLLEDEDE